MGILTNKTLSANGNWYAPSDHLQTYKSVEWVELVDTTSSAGDWNGIICQKIGDKRYLISFSQENNCYKPGGDWIIYTDDRYIAVTKEITRNKMVEIAIDTFYSYDRCSTCGRVL